MPISTSSSPDPLPEREQLIEIVTLHTCTRRCFGKERYAASCCKLEKRDYIIGPHGDTEHVLSRLSEKLGREVPFDEVFIGYEEGRDRFPDKSSWQDPQNFPALRVDESQPERLACRFLDDADRCSIHELRPQTCRNYRCGYLQTVVELL